MPKVAARVAGFLITLAVVIFTSAGTLDFWEGWLFWSSFSVSIIAMTAYLLIYDPALAERRLRSGPSAELRPRQKIIQAVNLAMFIGIVAISGLDHRLAWSHVPSLLVLFANLVMLAAFGFLLLVFSANTFAASTIVVENKYDGLKGEQTVELKLRKCCGLRSLFAGPQPI